MADLRTLLVRRLIRMKVLEGARLQRYYVVAIDATGYLLFRCPHCKYCLTQQHGETTLYMHQALEAKLLGPADTVLSMGTGIIQPMDVGLEEGDVVTISCPEIGELRNPVIVV